MSNNRNDLPFINPYVVAFGTAILLLAIYSLAETYITNLSVRSFIQGVCGNIFSTLLTLLAVYIFVIKTSLPPRPVVNLQQNLLDRIDSRFHELAREVRAEFSKLIELDSNNPLRLRLELFESQLFSKIQQMSKEIGKEVNTKLDLNSNDLYRFFGLKGTRTDAMFQDFRVYRGDPNRPNDSAVSFLYADTLFGNTINARIMEDSDNFLRVEFESCNAQSWGCNIAIRPQNQKASNLRTQENLKYLVFQARIPQEALQTQGIDDVGLAIRIINGKYQHWQYAVAPNQYVHFQINRVGVWKTFCIDLKNYGQWWNFSSDGNPYLAAEESRQADLSIISAVIIKFGKHQEQAVGELSMGKGVVDIKRIEFSENFIS